METNIPPCKASETIASQWKHIDCFHILADPIYIKIQPHRTQLEGASVTGSHFLSQRHFIKEKTLV